MPRKDHRQERSTDFAAADDERSRATCEPSARIDAKWLRAPATRAVFATLNKDGFQTRAVGGAVRNALLGLDATDVDFATTATPEEVMEIASSAGMGVHPTGLKHGTVTVVCDGTAFEVTTLRKDVATDGRRATVVFTKDWNEDARRRDFTMNALYCNIDGDLFDPVGGYRDLLNRVVRFIGDPRKRIAEDFLRILRFFRFFAVFGSGTIDQDGLDACIAEKAGLTTLSGERVRAEILRILGAANAIDALRIMIESGILELALGHAPKLGVVARLCAIENDQGVPPDAVLRLAALMIRSEADAHALAGKLRLSNTQARRLVRTATTGEDEQTADTPIAAGNAQEQRGALYRLGRQTYQDRCLLEWARSGASTKSPAHRKAFALPVRWSPPSMPFSGADLVARGFASGPGIGRVLSQFETWWVREDFPQSSEVLETKLLELANRGCIRSR